jgi:hypothetical protein
LKAGFFDSTTLLTPYPSIGCTSQYTAHKENHIMQELLNRLGLCVSVSVSLFSWIFFCFYFLSDAEHDNACAQSRSRDGDQGGGRKKQTLELTLPGVKGGT